MFSQKKRSYQGILFLFCIFNYHAIAQYNQWVWEKGSQLGGQPATYGSIGVSSPTNNPGRKYESLEFTDKKGNFWLFGGSQRDQNDLWKFDPVIKEWTLMGGDTAPGLAGIYGTKGVFSPGNWPGGRGYGSLSFSDNNGFLWMYGNNGYDNVAALGSLTDLWKYDPDPASPTFNQWAWMSGTDVAGSTSVYGAKKLPSTSKFPYDKSETSASWVDKSNNLWLLGGMSYFAFLQGRNDLWRFNTSTNEWAWMSGDSVVSTPSVYSAYPNQTDPLATPGGSLFYCSWEDNNNNLWIHGFGQEVWRYSVSAEAWAYDGGAGVPMSSGTKCIESENNNPGGQLENRARWSDDCGNLWMLAASAAQTDLWVFNISTNNWTYVNGGPFSYGTMGVAGPSNFPGARMGAVGWRNKDGLWLFGGLAGNMSSYSGEKNDLWRYIPDKPTAEFAKDTIPGCASVNFINLSNSNCNIIRSTKWNFDDIASGSSNTSSVMNPTHIFQSTGVHTVKLVVTSCTGSADSITHTVKIDAIQPMTVSPSLVVVCLASSTKITATGSGNYVWTPASSLSATNGPSVFCSATVSGTYMVTGTDAGGCKSEKSFEVQVGDCSEITIPNIITPNGDGVNDDLDLNSANVVNFKMTLFNRWGDPVFESENVMNVFKGVNGSGTDVPDGVYYYVLYATGNTDVKYSKTGFITVLR